MKNKKDFNDYKNFVNGPSVMEAKAKKGLVSMVVRTATCDDWNGNKNNLISLDIRDHDKHIDLYSFSILDFKNNTGYFVGWIYYDELIEKAEAVFEDNTIYLILPINKLRSAKSLTNILLKKGGDKHE